MAGDHLRNMPLSPSSYLSEVNLYRWERTKSAAKLLTQLTVVMVTELEMKLRPSFILTYRFAALEKKIAHDFQGLLFFVPPTSLRSLFEQMTGLTFPRLEALVPGTADRYLLQLKASPL